jgi:hypothetical protein
MTKTREQQTAIDESTMYSFGTRGKGTSPRGVLLERFDAIPPLELC